jgi:hypothetical protein
MDHKLTLIDKIAHTWNRTKSLDPDYLDNIQYQFDQLLRKPYALNKIEQLIRLYRHGAKIFSNQVFQMSYVVEIGDTESLKFLISNGLNIEYIPDHSTNVAVMANHVNMLKLLHSIRDFGDFNTWCALTRSCVCHTNADAVNFLLKFHSDVSNQQMNDIFLLVVQHNNLMLANELINHIYRFIQPFKSSTQTCIKVANSVVSIDMYNLIVDLMTDKNTFKVCVLVNSVDKHNELVDHILCNGMDVPLLNCCLDLLSTNSNTRLDIISKLVTLGADIAHGMNATFVSACKNNSYAIAEYCMLRGVDINYPDSRALIVTVENKNINMLRWLIRHGVNSQTESLHDYIKTLIVNGRTAILAWVVRNIDHCKVFALKHSIYMGSHASVQCVLRCCRINYTQSHLNAALKISCNYSNLEIIKLLIDCGADTDVINRDRLFKKLLDRNYNMTPVQEDIYKYIVSFTPKFINAPVTNAECIIDLGIINRGELYACCTSNVRHYVRAEYLKRIKKNTCCYCREPMDKQIYRNRPVAFISAQSQHSFSIGSSVKRVQNQKLIYKN